MEPIRILHASDLHIAQIANLKSVVDSAKSWSSLFGFLKHPSLANSYDPTIFQEFAEFVNKQTALDAILITGDIATTGDYADLAKAHRFFEGGITTPWFGTGSIEPTFDKLRQTVWMLPGNHDRFEKTLPRGFTPGGTEFHNVFDKFWDEDVRRYPVLTRPGFSVAVLGADFSLRSPKDCGRWPPNRYSRGRAYADVLEKLESETNKLARDQSGPIAVLWAIHFPPDYPDLPSYMKLLRSEDIIKAGNNCGVRAVLAGHTHKRKRYGRTPVMKFEVLCAGTATEHIPTEPNHFQILNIRYAHDGFHIQLEHYEFDRGRGEFHEVFHEP